MWRCIQSFQALRACYGVTRRNNLVPQRSQGGCRNCKHYASCKEGKVLLANLSLGVVDFKTALRNCSPK